LQGNCRLGTTAVVHLTKKRTVGVRLTWRLWGGAHFTASAPGRRKPWLRHCWGKLHRWVRAEHEQVFCAYWG